MLARLPGALTNRVWLRVLLLACLSGCATPGTGGGGPPSGPVATISDRKVAVEIESSPENAVITVNGAIKGATPLTIAVELDDTGDVAVDVELSANFADSSDLKKANVNSAVSFRIPKGERPPRVVTFDSDGASSR